MMIFQDIQDVEEWMAAQSYASIWQAAKPWSLFDEEHRQHCDELIASGNVQADTILEGLRIMVRLAMTERFGLKDRVYEPSDAQYLHSVH